MDSLAEYKTFFADMGVEIQQEVSVLLDRLSHHTPESMVAVSDRIGN